MPLNAHIARNAASAANAPEISRLFEEYAPFVRDLARHLLGRAADADDALQEVFVIAWRKFDRDRFESARTWLASVTLRVCSAMRRRSWIRRHLGLDDLPEDPADPRSPEAEVEAREALRAFEHLTLAMSEKKRAVLVLSDIHGFSGQEISQLVGCPIETVYSRLHHARRELVVLLAQAGLAPAGPDAPTQQSGKGGSR